MIEEVGHTAADSTSVRAISFSDEGTRLCTANNDTLRVWSWDPVSLQHAHVIGWDRVYEMKVASESDNLVAGAFSSNFVSLWSVDLGELSEQQASSVEEGEDRGLVQDLRAQEREREQMERLAAGGYRAPTVSSKKKAGREDKEGGGGGKGVYMHDLSDEEEVGEDPYVPSRAAREKGGDRGPAKVRSAFESPERPLPAKEEPGGVPGVQWEGGVDGNVLASSMGESFLKRVRAEEEARLFSQAQAQEQEQRSVHDKFPAAAVKHMPGRRPQTREREAAVASRRVERRAQAAAGMRKDPVEDLGLGLAVVGLGRPQSSAVKGELGGAARETPPQPPVRHVVNKQTPVSRYSPLGGEGGGGAEERDRDKGGGYGARQEPRRAASDLIPSVSDGASAPVAVGRASSFEEDFAGRGGGGVGRDIAESAVTAEQRIESAMASLDTGGDLAISVLSQRLTNLRLLRNYWERGEMLSIIDHLHTILTTSTVDMSNTQGVVVADFFTSLDWKSSVITLDVCGQLLPLLEAMLDTGNNTLIAAALRGVESLSESFGSLIRQTRAVVVPGGVDITREERLQKCNVSFVTFARIRSKLDGVRHHQRKNLAMRSAIDKVQGLLSDMM